MGGDDPLGLRSQGSPGIAGAEDSGSYYYDCIPYYENDLSQSASPSETESSSSPSSGPSIIIEGSSAEGYSIDSSAIYCYIPEQPNVFGRQDICPPSPIRESSSVCIKNSCTFPEDDEEAPTVLDFLKYSQTEPVSNAILEMLQDQDEKRSQIFNAFFYGLFTLNRPDVFDRLVTNRNSSRIVSQMIDFCRPSTINRFVSAFQSRFLRYAKHISASALVCKILEKTSDPNDINKSTKFKNFKMVMSCIKTHVAELTMNPIGNNVINTILKVGNASNQFAREMEEVPQVPKWMFQELARSIREVCTTVDGCTTYGGAIRRTSMDGNKKYTLLLVNPLLHFLDKLILNPGFSVLVRYCLTLNMSLIDGAFREAPTSSAKDFFLSRLGRTCNIPKICHLEGMLPLFKWLFSTFSSIQLYDIIASILNCKIFDFVNLLRDKTSREVIQYLSQYHNCEALKICISEALAIDPYLHWDGWK